ncbi:unnamed protein product [Durusdinium trenchii]|uniref:Nitronate monooxygenase domain-containing protein n=1 Tax=Durusdinium trenchii TaxID=1381693 RepID=A0ABP0LDZ8_9DINO
MAPMAGASPVALAAAVTDGGGMAACGVLGMSPSVIAEWSSSFRAQSGPTAPLQLNTWIPDPPALRDPQKERKMRDFLQRFGPEVPEAAGDAKVVDFEAQVAAMIEAKPTVISSIMGLYPQEVVRKMKEQKIKWFAVATTVSEAIEAEAAGADAIIVDAVKVPVIATGGIADARQAAAAFVLGASAVQIGTGLLRCPEAGISRVWADALGQSRPEDTAATRAFSGRLGRSMKTAYVLACQQEEAPEPAPYPVQRGLTTPMRTQAAKTEKLDGMMAWAGQSAGLASEKSARQLVADVWIGAMQMLDPTSPLSKH